MQGLVIWAGFAAAALWIIWPRRSSSSTPRKLHPATMDEMKAYAAMFRADAASADLRGIPVDLALAVSALETGWGRGRIFRATNGYFSMTIRPNGLDWRGRPHRGETVANDLGQRHVKYATRAASISDWAALMAEAGRYRAAYAHALAGNAREFFDALELAGYAGDREDPRQGKDYGAKLAVRFQQIQGVA